MVPFKYLLLFLLLNVALAAQAENNFCEPPCPKPNTNYFTPCPSCCDGRGGVLYCDSSAGRFVCNDGNYSVCYCDRHAVMALEKIQGCCLWQGGVLTVSDEGVVICNDGSVAELCSVQNMIHTPHQMY